MANLIYIKLDFTQIDQSRLFEGKGGKRYLDLVCVPSSKSQYGDTHFITQSATKDERQAGKRMPIIGNAKEQPPRGEQQRAPERQQPAAQPTGAAGGSDEDVPF